MSCASSFQATITSARVTGPDAVLKQRSLDEAPFLAAPVQRRARRHASSMMSAAVIVKAPSDRSRDGNRGHVLVSVMVFVIVSPARSGLRLRELRARGRMNRTQLINRTKLAALARHDVLDQAADPFVGQIEIRVEADDERAMNRERAWVLRLGTRRVHVLCLRLRLEWSCTGRGEILRRF